MSKFLSYTFYQRDNGVTTIRTVNTEKILDVLFQKNNEGKLNSLQLLMDAPTNMYWDAIPDKAKMDREGRIIVNKLGEQEVTFSKKQVQKHIIITIQEEADMRKFATFLGVDPNQFIYLTPEEIFGISINADNPAVKDDFNKNAESETFPLEDAELIQN